MKRRQFSATVLGAAAASWRFPCAAQAQSDPVEGKHYLRLPNPIPVSTPPGRFEVIQFFWYGCPHCAALEPALELWAHQLPADVVFVRVPVAFSAEPFTAHQRIFYALEAMGLVEAMHQKVFNAIHQERMRLARPADISAFMAKNGVDPAKFMEAFNSFGTAAHLRQANKLVDAYQVDGVPAFGVQGRFYTSGTLAGGNERALLVVDYLIQRLRKNS
jgi:protein dithiol oxidoreductase (disulfide-forming)